MTPTIETEAKPAAFETSPDTILLGKRLGALAKGEFVSYSALNDLVPDRHLTGRDRFILDSARSYALKESNSVTECVTGEGLKRLTDDELAELPQHVIAGVRRKARKGLAKASKAIPEQMTNGSKAKWLYGLSALGAVAQCLRRSTLLKLENRVAETGKRVGFSFFPKLSQDSPTNDGTPRAETAPHDTTQPQSE